jgi:hypothetical protein
MKGCVLAPLRLYEKTVDAGKPAAYNEIYNYGNPLLTGLIIM